MEMRWANAAFGAIFPSGASERIPLGICDMDLEGYLTDIRSRVSFRTALALRATLWVIAFSPILVLGRPRTLASLDQAARERVLAAILASSIYLVRQLAMLLKTVGAVFYASHPAVREGILGEAPAPAASGPQLVQLGRGARIAPALSEREGRKEQTEQTEQEAQTGEEGRDEQSVA